MTCRGCGCTDEFACPGGCFWIAPGLCSACAAAAAISANAELVLVPPPAGSIDSSEDLGAAA